MQLKQEQIQDFKNLMEKKGGKDISWDEATEGAYKLVGLVELLMKMRYTEIKWNERLESEPKGFSVEGNGRNCGVCKKSMKEYETWYDKWGLKCKTCQKAIDKKIIPGSIIKKDDSWYSEYDLTSRFNLPKKVLNAWIKNGVIKARIILNDNGTQYTRLFLIKDNKEFLPPKKLVESHLVKTTDEEGRDWHHSEPWYKFFDPFEHLKGYKIMDMMQKTVDKENKE